MAQSPTLVIFDCDGVLVDSELPANRTFRLMLAEQGLEMTLAETVGLLKGLSLPACAALLKDRFGLVLPEDFLDQLQQRTYLAFREELRAVPGIRDTVEALALPFCVASSGAIEKMHFTLGLTGLLDLFRDCMFSAEQVARGKPFPDLFLHAAQQMGHSPDACVVIEDSLPGVRAAQAAGMDVLGFAGTELADADELASAGAAVFNDMRELPALVTKPHKKNPGL